MTDVLTANNIVRRLAALGRDLDDAVEMLRGADVDAVTKRHVADLAESHAFLNAEGSMDIRRHTARLAVEEQESEALVAEALVRYLRTQIRAVETRIEIGRSVNAAHRAELNALPGRES